jgi:drug/metabolite transporter (DMT)-like permease
VNKPSRPSAGIAYIVFTAGCFAASDATVKHLGAALPVLVLLWSRYVFQTTVLAALQATRRGWRDLLRSGHPRLQAVRAALLVSTTNLWSGLGALVLLCVALIALPVDVLPALSRASSAQWLLIGVLGAAATLGQMSMVQAIRLAPLSMLTPFGYAQIAFAALIGWLMFRHAPDLWSAAGMTVIVCAGAATVWLNAREKARATRIVALIDG